MGSFPVWSAPIGSSGTIFDPNDCNTLQFLSNVKSGVLFVMWVHTVESESGKENQGEGCGNGFCGVDCFTPVPNWWMS